LIRLIQCIFIQHPDEFYVEHMHNHHEMVYCLEGDGEVFIRGKRMKFSTGNYYVVHRASPHAEKDCRSCRIIYFHFDAPDSLIHEGSYTDYDGSVASIVKRLHQESESTLSKKEEMLRALITQLLIEAERAAENTHPERNLVLLMQYINENIEQDFDFHQLAAQHHYSYDRFRHLFKLHSGLSPHQYILRQRIEKAKFALQLNPHTSITEIAYQCGFSSSAQFCNQFAARVGIPPSQYRKQLLGEQS